MLGRDGREVLVHRQGLEALLVHAQHVRQLEEAARLETRQRARLADAHQRAAVTHPCAQGLHELRIRPHVAAGERRVHRAAVDDHVDVRVHAVLEDVIEADEPDVDAHAGQGLQDPVIRVRLLVGQRVRHGERHPRTHPAPRVQNRHVQLTLGRHVVRAVMDVAELVRDVRDGVHELRELRGQGQVAAVAHAGDRGPEDRAAGFAPVVEPLDARVVALIERVREEVRQETALRVFDAGNVRDHAGRGAVADRTHHRIQAQLVEPVLVGFSADPLVAQEHHRLLAGRMGHVRQLLDVLAHEARQEVDPVALGLSGHTPCAVVGATIHKVLRTQTISIFLLEVVQGTRAHGAGTAEPVDHLFATLGVEQQCELVEERGETHHISLRAVLQPPRERVEHELSGGGMVDVERDLVLLVAPVVGQMVVHLDRIPDDVGQERNRVLVHRHGSGHVHGILARVQRPLFGRHDFARRAIHDLPIPVRVRVTVRLELLLEETIHQRHIHRIRLRQDTIRQQVHLRRLVHMQSDPLVMRTRREIRTVYLLAKSEHILIKMRAIRVADSIRAPQFGKLLGLLSKILLTRQSEAASTHEFSSIERSNGKAWRRNATTKNGRRHRGS